MLQAHHLSKTYNTKKGISCPAVIDVSLEFGKTGMVFILGKSGSGKSTMLNLLSGLDKPDSGEIIVDGHSLKDFTEKDYDNYRNSCIGFIFQEFNLIESMTVKDNLSVALELQNKKSKAEDIEKALHAVGLDGLGGRMPDELSGGQKQRVAIARALIKTPHIIFADEPTGNLDSETGKDIIELLKALSREKLIIVVTHDRELAETYGDRIIEIQNGQILSDFDKASAHNADDPWKYETTIAKLPNRFAVKLAFTAFSEKKGKLFLTILLSIFSLLIFSLSFLLASFDLEKQVVANMKKTDDSLLFAAQIQGEMGEYRIFDNIQAYFGNEIIGLMWNNDADVTYLSGTDSLYYFPINQLDQYIAFQSGILIKRKSDLEKMNLSLLPNALEIDDDSMYITDYLYAQIAGLKLEKLVNFEWEVTDISTFFIKDELGNNIDLEDLNVGDLPGKTIYERSMISTEDYIEEKLVKIAGIVDTDYEYYQCKADSLTDDEKEVYNLKMAFNYTMLFFNSVMYNKCKEKIYKDSFNLNYNEAQPVIPFYDISINSLNIEYLNISKTTYYTPLFGTGEIDDQSLVLDLDVYNRIFGESKTMYDYFNPETRTTKEVPSHLGEKITIQICDKEGTLLRELKDYKIADISFSGRNTITVDDKTYEKLLPLSKGRKYLMINMPESTEESLSLLNDLSSQGFSFFSPYSMELYQFQDKISLFSKIFSAASVLLLVFSILLIMNFISTSVTIRKKEIGILRGLGARTADVAKIFNFEGLFIATLIASINIILLIFGVQLIEKVFASALAAPATYISLTSIHIEVVLSVSFLVVLLSSVLPVKRVGRMRPVDAIRKVS